MSHCRSIMSPIHGNFYGRKRLYSDDDVVEFFCNPEYTMVGPSELRCYAGSWDGSEPQCEGNTDLALLLANSLYLQTIFKRIYISSKRCMRNLDLQQKVWVLSSSVRQSPMWLSDRICKRNWRRMHPWVNLSEFCIFLNSKIGEYRIFQRGIRAPITLVTTLFNIAWIPMDRPNAYAKRDIANRDWTNAFVSE